MAPQAEAFLTIDAGLDVQAPALVLEIPGDGAPQAGLERLARPPAQLAVDLAGVDGIPAVVAPAIGDERDQPGVRDVRRVGPHLVQERADLADDRDVGPLVMAADVVRLAGDAL